MIINQGFTCNFIITSTWLDKWKGEKIKTPSSHHIKNPKDSTWMNHNFMMKNNKKNGDYMQCTLERWSLNVKEKCTSEKYYMYHEHCILVNGKWCF
jgi:hypothetical protein